MNNFDDKQKVVSENMDDKFWLRVSDQIFEEMKSNHIGESKSLEEYVKMSREKLEKLFAAVLHTTGGGYTDPLHYYTTFNPLDNLPYFDPHVAGRLHVFFVRPVCNIRDDNLDADSFLTGLLNTIEGNVILANLFNPICNPNDPEVNNKKNLDDLINHYKNKVFGNKTDTILDLFKDDTPASLINKSGDKRYSTVYDNVLKLTTNNVRSMGFTPFMPILTNMCVGMSGIPDLFIGKYQYDADFQQNQQVIASGMDENNGPCEIQFTFRENSNLGVSALHLAWLLYMHNVSKGKMSPFPGFVKKKTIDYMTSVYWFFVGQDGMSIKVYGRFTGGFPLNVPISSLVTDRRGSSITPEISITYSFSHKEIMKPIILYEFNTLVKRSIGLLSTVGSEHGVTITPFPVLNATFTNNNSIIGDRTLRKEINKKKNAAPSSSNMFGRIYSGNNGELYPSLRNLFRGHPIITHDGKLLYCDLAYRDHYDDEGNVDVGKTRWITIDNGASKIETPYID